MKIVSSTQIKYRFAISYTNPGRSYLRGYINPILIPLSMNYFSGYTTSYTMDIVSNGNLSPSGSCTVRYQLYNSTNYTYVKNELIIMLENLLSGNTYTYPLTEFTLNQFTPS